MSSFVLNGQTMTNEMKKLYTSTLRTLFDNINYYISKKNTYYKEIIEKTKKIIEKIDNLSEEISQNADNYFPLIFKSLTIENYKLAKNTFPHLKILIKNSFITGSTPLNYFNIDFEQFNENEEFFKHGKIIDLMIECLTNIDSTFEDDDIWCLSLECLDEMVKNPNIICNIKGKNFQKIYNYYLRIFSKLENEKDTISSIKEKITYLVNNSIEELNSFLNFSSPLLSNNNIKNNLMEIYNKLGTAECIDNSTTNNYNPLDLYICRQVKTLVDIICIREARGELKFINNENSNNILPLVPKKNDDFTKIKIKVLEQPKILNEYSYRCGFFGWCYICRKESNHYCLDIRVPICNYICKDKLLKEERQLLKIRTNLIKDCAEMFKYFCQILSNKSSTTMQKIFTLEIIGSILNNFDNKYKFLSHQKNFIKVVKENLSEGLFKTCLSPVPNIFIPSISLFFDVWKIFRVNLKREIGFFNNNIFLKILSSANSSFLQKKVILENFSKCDFLYFIELYANFDCELNERFTVSSIITSFSDIVKGRYNNSNHSYSEEENYELVNLALKTLTSMVQSIFEICEKEHPQPRNTYSSKEIEINSALNSTDTNFLVNNNKNINATISECPTETNEKIEHNLKKKYELKTAAEKFNYKIKSGIAYLRKVGYLNCSSIDTEAKGMVKFLRYTSSLKKKNIGEFLGENNELSIKTLKYFGESFDFKNVHIIQALRIFLSTFQLPSEGQKIDRVLESFASKYYNDNNTLFTNADCAYYLSYAIMILQTELHNPNLKERMSLETFMKIFEEKEYENLTKEYLEDIYKQIQEEPLSLPELEEEREKNVSDKIEEKYAREKQRIVNEYAFNKKLNNKNFPYIKLKENEFLEYLSQFISSIWEPLITMYSIVIEESDDSSLYNQGISGLSNCIKILGLLNLNTQKQTVISFLCAMTNLLHIKPLKKKNILCIKEILYLANTDYRYTKGSWSFILDIINKLCYYLLLYSMPKDEREEIFDNKMKNYSKKAKNNIISYEEILNLDKERMKQVAKEITQNDFEKIFSKTLSFDSNTLIEFVGSMCDITKREFQNNTQTRIFFLQKIVEVVEINLFNRPRFNLANIWKILSEFFVEIGISSNIENSTTSIDALRQLTMKYLEKDESKEYHFQAQFFKPFLEISKKNQDMIIQEYIICCIINLIRNNEKKIKSGWTVILNIFEEIFKLPDDVNLQNQTLDILEYVSINNYEEISDIFEQFSKCLKLYLVQFPEKVIDIFENFIPKVENEKNFKILINCFIPLILHNNEKIRNQSLSDFSNCINKRLKPDKSNLHELGKNQSFWKNLITQLLLPTLSELIKKISSLNYIINNNNISFVTINNNQTIDTTNNNISNLDNSFENNNNGNNSKNGIKNTILEKGEYCNTLENSLIKIANVFNDFYSLNYKELPKFFEFLEKIIFSEDEKIQNTGLECVKFMHGSEKIKNKSFLQNFTLFLTTLANKSLEDYFSTISEKEFSNILKTKKNNNKIDMNLSLCFIHFNVLYLLDKLLSQSIQYLSDDILNKLLDCLEASIMISNNFNSNIQLRLTITEYNKNVPNPLSSMAISIANNEVINLFRQFQFALKNFFVVGEFLYNKENEPNIKQKYYQRIINFSIKIINYYNNKNKEFFNLINKPEKEKEFKEKEAELNNYVLPLCDYVFPSLQKIEFYNDEKRDIICNLLFELILCYDQRIRDKIKDILNVVFVKIFKSESQNKNE